MYRVVPDDWRLLRGLLALLIGVAVGLGAGWILDRRPFWDTGPLWVSIAVHLALPLLFATAVWFSRRRLPTTVRPYAALVALVGVLTFVGDAALTFVALSYRDELERVLPPSCGPELESCHELARSTFGEPLPSFPPAEFDPYRFVGGERHGDRLLFSYSRPAEREGAFDNLGVVVSRDTGEQFPEEGESATSPGGTTYWRLPPTRTTSRILWRHRGYRYLIAAETTLGTDETKHAAVVRMLDAIVA